MEKWRIYLILAGIILVVYNYQNVDFSNPSESYMALIAMLASLLLVVLLILFHKRK